jgi:hypothetical protein
MKFVILRSEHKNETKTILVNEEEYVDSEVPNDFFAPPFDLNAKNVGEIEVEGDINLLGNIYVEEM